MSSQGIFVVGLLITLVVCVAFGILAYGIVLDRRYLRSVDQQHLGPSDETVAALATDGRDDALLRHERPPTLAADVALTRG